LWWRMLCYRVETRSARAAQSVQALYFINCKHDVNYIRFGRQSVKSLLQKKKQRTLLALSNHSFSDDMCVFVCSAAQICIKCALLDEKQNKNKK
jgi:hypothetical protein